MATEAIPAVDELQDMFPQLSRTTILDVLDQAGTGAVECLLELCTNMEEGTQSGGTSWSGGWGVNSDAWRSFGGDVDDLTGALTAVDLAAPSRGWWKQWEESQTEKRVAEKVLANEEHTFWHSNGVAIQVGTKGAKGNKKGGRGSGAAQQSAGISNLNWNLNSNSGSPVAGSRVDSELAAASAPSQNGWNSVSENGGGLEMGWDSVSEGPVNVLAWSTQEAQGANTENSSASNCERDSDCSDSSGDVDSESQKIRFLAMMFADYELCEETLRSILETSEWDVGASLDTLLQMTGKIDCDSNLADVAGNCYDAEADHVSKLGELNSAFPGLGDGTLLSILETTGGDFQRALSLASDVAAECGNKPDIFATGPIDYASVFQKERNAFKSQDTKGPPDDRGWVQAPLQPNIRKKVKILRKSFGSAPKEEFLLELLRGVNYDVKLAANLLRESGLKEICPPVEETAAKLPTSNGSSVAKVLPHNIDGGMSQNDFEALYNEQRRRAIELGVLKDKTFKEAAMAYSKGYKDLAKNLSILGRDYARQAQSEHRHAAQTIFKERNANIVNTFAVDLHGMHVEEAIGKVKWALTDVKGLMDKLPTKKVIRLVTGRGKHSPDSVGKLYAAINDFLVHNRVPFSKGSGYFDVSLNENLGKFSIKPKSTK